jgi:transcriptional regulator with XRE-family HTH domain
MTLKEYRIKNNKTLIDMALLLRVSVNTIILWERGVNAPSPENQEKIDALLQKGEE